MRGDDRMRGKGVQPASGVGGWVGVVAPTHPAGPPLPPSPKSLQHRNGPNGGGCHGRGLGSCLKTKLPKKALEEKPLQRRMNCLCHIREG